MADMEALSFDISVKSGDAAKQLDSLASSLERVKKAVSGGLKLGNTSTQLSKLNEVLNNLTSYNAAKLEKLTKALSNLGNMGKVNIPPSLTKRVTELSSAAASISPQSIANLTNLGNALQSFQGLQNVNIPNITMPQNAGGTSATQSPTQAASQSAVDLGGSPQTQAVNNQLSLMQQLAGNAGNAIKGLAKNLVSLGSSVAGQVVPGLSAMSEKMMQLPLLIGSRLASGVKNATASLGGLFSGLVRIAKFRLFRSVIKLFTEGMSQGLENLYYWSQTVGDGFASSMDRIATASQYVSNSFAAMASPLINALSPAIDFIADKIVALFNLINQLFARLSGKSTYVAAKKVSATWKGAASDAGKGASGAAKKAADEIKRYTLGFDELNILGQKDKKSSGGGGGGGAGGGAGGGTGYGDMFETLPIDSSVMDLAEMLKKAWADADFTEVGKLVGQKLKKALDDIPWGDIQNSARRIAKSLATFLNGFLETEGLSESVGKTIGQALNTAFIFVNTFVKEFHWDSLGKFVTSGIQSAFREFDWGNLTGFISGIQKAFFDTITGAIKGIDWRALPKDFVDGVKEAFKGYDFKGVFGSLGGMIGAALTAAIDLSQGIDDLVQQFFKDIADYFGRHIEESKAAGGGVIEGILDGILDGVKGIGNWIWTNVVKPFIDGFKKNFQINSPSKVMQDIGKDVIDGFLKGIKDFFNDPFGWVKKNITDPIVQAIKGFDPVGELKKTAGGVKQVAVELTAKQKPSFVKGKEAFDGLVDGGAEKTLTAGVTTLFNTSKKKYEEVKDNTVTKSITGREAPSFTNARKTYTGLTNATATKTLSGIETKAFTTVKTSFNSVATNTAKKTITGKDTKSFDNVWTWYRQITDNSAKKTITGKNKKSFDDVWTWYRQITSNSATKTTYGKTTKGFTNTKDSYNGIYSRTATVTVTTSGTSKLDALQRKISNVMSALKKMGNVNVNPGGRALGGIFEHGAWSDIPQYAGGGTVHGSMFIAGENGPELVGHVGGRTEVLNRSQLAATMYASVRNALAETASAAVGALAHTMADSTNALSTAILYTGARSDQELASLLGNMPTQEPAAPRDDSYEAIRTAMLSSTERQNQLLREQNDLLQQILDKDSTVEITANSFVKAAGRKNRRDGRTIIPIST